MSLISCSNWSLPLKYDSTIWSFIKLFSGTAEKDVVFLKKNRKKVCHVFYWRRLRRRKRGKKRGKKKRRVFPIIGHFGGLRKPKVVPVCPPPASQSSWPPGRGHETGQVRRPEPTPRPCSCLRVWAQLSTACKRWASPSPSSLKRLIQTSLLLSENLVSFSFLSFNIDLFICIWLHWVLDEACGSFLASWGIFLCADSSWGAQAQELLSIDLVPSQRESESRSVVSDSLRPPGLYGILQARILGWVAFPFSRGSSQRKDWSQVSCISGGFFTSWWDLSFPTRDGTQVPCIAWWILKQGTTRRVPAFCFCFEGQVFSPYTTESSEYV